MKTSEFVYKVQGMIGEVQEAKEERGKAWTVSREASDALCRAEDRLFKARSEWMKFLDSFEPETA